MPFGPFSLKWMPILVVSFSKNQLDTVIHLETGSSESRDSHSQKPVSPSDISVSPIFRSFESHRVLHPSVYELSLRVTRTYQKRFYCHIVTFSLWRTNEIMNNLILYRGQSQNLFHKFEPIDPPVLPLELFYQCTIKIEFSSFRTKFHSV